VSLADADLSEHPASGLALRPASDLGRRACAVKVLLTGSGGQLGRALLHTRPPEIELVAYSRSELDITDSHAVFQRVGAQRPHLIINAAAYTNVDRAEGERDLAQQTNVDGARHLAMAARSCESRLIHVSTDFVFDGGSSQPYRPDDAPHPLNVYGATKEEGERAVLAALPDSVILRTAWLYWREGLSFVSKMLAVMQARGAVRVVSDQVGTPTSAESLAVAIWRIASATQVTGIHHWTDAGVASWYDFAVAIAEEAALLKLLTREVGVAPISSKEYPTAARRPAYSVLDSTSLRSLGITPVHWRVHLRRALRGMSAPARQAALSEQA
jgi:dTDP-4-dehydrorhamnose reductase